MWRITFLLLPLLALAGCAPKPIEGLKTYAYAGGQQQEGKIAYAETPPLGGAYSPIWQRCGVYTAPIYDEYGVHSLERGAVWITYTPTLAAAEVAKLKTLLAEYSSVLLSPRGGLPTPVVISVWNAQVQAKGAGDERLKAFLDDYAQPVDPARIDSARADHGRRNERKSTAPEASLGCASGYTGTQ
jgi:Protein of unknown function (DUF3105)